MNNSYCEPESDGEDCAICPYVSPRRGGKCSNGFCKLNNGCCSKSALPFDVAAIESIILTLGDKFDLRVALDDNRVQTSMVVAAGLATAGVLIGGKLGGRVGAALGGALGGVAGAGVAVFALRDVWEDLKPRLPELYDVVYDYLSGLDVKDYASAARMILDTGSGGPGPQIAMLMIDIMCNILGKKVLSSITA